MIDYSEFWNPHTLAKGETLSLALGALDLRLRRGGRDWHLAYESDAHENERFSFRIQDDAFNPEREWTRWILDEKIEEFRLQAQLPDRPIIVRPERPMCLMPRQSILLFIGIPIWLSLVFGRRSEQAVEVPSMILSNSWFGSFTEGELCYALKTTAKLHCRELVPAAHRAVFPLEIKNASSEKLKFERLCIRPQYLNVFQGDSRLWTSKGRVSYRGEDKWSRIIYASNAPEYDGADAMVGRARAALKRGVLLNTFDTLKQRVEL